MKVSRDRMMWVRGFEAQCLQSLSTRPSIFALVADYLVSSVWCHFCFVLEHVVILLGSISFSLQMFLSCDKESNPERLVRKWKHFLCLLCCPVGWSLSMYNPLPTYFGWFKDWSLGPTGPSASIGVSSRSWLLRALSEADAQLLWWTYTLWRHC